MQVTELAYYNISILSTSDYLVYLLLNADFTTNSETQKQPTASFLYRTDCLTHRTPTKYLYPFFLTYFRYEDFLSLNSHVRDIF